MKSSKKKASLIVIFLVLFSALAVSGCVTQKQADFEVSDLAVSPKEAKIGENITVTARVTNIGDSEGSKNISLLVDGSPVNSRNVDLAAGENTTISFTIQKEVAGDCTVELGNLTRTIEVLEPAKFEVSNLDVSPKEIKPGENTTVIAEIKNIGEVRDTKTIKLFIDKEVEETKEITLNPKEKTTTSFTIQKKEPGNHTIQIKNQAIKIKIQKPIEKSKNNFTVSVAEVIDGDTLEVRFSNDTIEKVRLIGVDTPEKYGSNSPSEFEGIENTSYLHNWGIKASDFTKSQLGNLNVTLRYDEVAGRRGYYGRLLAYIYLPNGTMFNEMLIERGYARVYSEGDFKREAAFLSLEEDARSNYRGLWNALNTSGEGGLEISYVHYDASGNDHENLNGEWVEIGNSGNSTISLEGYTLVDEAGHTYHFLNISLAPRENLTLYTGSGEDTSTELYWGSGTAIWNNGGDTAFLYNGTNELVDSYQW